MHGRDALLMMVCLSVSCMPGCWKDPRDAEDARICENLFAMRTKCHKHFVEEESEYLKECKESRGLTRKYIDPTDACVFLSDCPAFDKCWAQVHIEMQNTIAFCDNFYHEGSTGVFCHSKILTDLAPLREIKKLGGVYLQGCERLSDLKPLEGLSSIEDLNLSGTSVRDLSPLQKLVNLKSLILSGTPVSASEIESLQSALPEVKITKAN
ncbi:MAG: hypothetical protein JXR96_00080 [Deltaproteobacteria bacterium]|nr:hypothetical protein [Deltaproteobacteria bacterium]